MKVTATPISQFAFKGIFQGLQKTDQTIKVDYTLDNRDTYFANRQVEFAKIDYPISKAIYRPYSWEKPQEYPTSKTLPIEIEGSDGKFIEPKEYKAKVAIGKKLSREESLELTYRDDADKAVELKKASEESRLEATKHSDIHREKTRTRFFIFRPKITTSADAESSLAWKYGNDSILFATQSEELRERASAKNRELNMILEAKKNNKLVDISTCENAKDLNSFGELMHAHRKHTGWISSQLVCLPNETMPLIDALLMALHGSPKDKVATMSMDTKKTLLKGYQEQEDFVSRTLYGIETMLTPKGDSKISEPDGPFVI